MIVVDRIDRTTPEATARITIVQNKPRPAGVSDTLVRRLSYETKFRCTDRSLRYGASTFQLESGLSASDPESNAVWEHPSPQTAKAKAIAVVCEPTKASALRRTQRLDALEREYRGQV